MKKDLSKSRILITGGGSGGHTSAAMAIIEELKKRYPDITERILYLGSNLGMVGEEKGGSLESKIVPQNGIQYKTIRAGKLQRFLSLQSVTLLFGVWGGVIDALREIREFKPDLIISTGGFVTVPVCFAGWLKGVPVILHEQTAAIGLTNRITSRFAKRIYISFPSSARYLPKSKTLHVGNAVRPQIFNTNGEGEVVDAVRGMLELKESKPIILVAGGGQGSHILNLTLRQMVRYLVEDYQIVLQTGDNKTHRDYDVLVKERLKLPEKLQSRFFPVKFIDANQIGYLFKHIDLYVGRAGANFVYEMGVMKKPSIFIPIPWVTHNEQYKNAKTLEELGLGKILPEGELTAERLYNEINRMFRKIRGGELIVDKKALIKTFPTDAAKKIVDDLAL